MFDQEQVDRLLAGVDGWNSWRTQNEGVVPKLTGADLKGAKLRDVDLHDARLHGANLNQANLESANLRGARLGEANLSGAKLTGAYLNNADLSGANLRSAAMFRARLDGAKLPAADLRKANLEGASLAGANLEEADLRGACLRSHGSVAADEWIGQVDLRKANLYGANLTGADLLGANLTAANLQAANLTGTDLTAANLQGALLDRAIMINTKLDRANLTGASIYGVSVWNVTTENARQHDLVIRRSEQDAPFTLDDLEVAQFIYMMLENQRVRRIIDKITSKVVLILGRFSAEHKPVLDGLREELRKRAYLPIIFDFEKPESRNLTETIGTLAHLARFVIADLTDAKSLPQELLTIIPNLPSVPVKPIIRYGSEEYAMFEHFRSFAWVLPKLQYRSQESLLAALDEKIIAQAEQMAKRQQSGATAVDDTETV